MMRIKSAAQMILNVCFTDEEDKVSSTDDTKPESEQEVPSTSHTVTKPVATTTTPTVGLFGEQTWLLNTEHVFLCRIADLKIVLSSVTLVTRNI